MDKRIASFEHARLAEGFIQNLGEGMDANNVVASCSSFPEVSASSFRVISITVMIIFAKKEVKGTQG
jgi:hypothetical protein